MTCLNCGKELTGKQKKFCCKKCKDEYFNKNVRADYSRVKARVIKWYLVSVKGGKCERCGYNTNLSALSFHHINPETKEFEIDARSCANRSIESLLEEVNKCQLLCCNCHAELHNPDLIINENSDFKSKDLLKKWVNSEEATSNDMPILSQTEGTPSGGAETTGEVESS